MIIPLHKNPYGHRWNVFSKASVDLVPGVTILIGCNGYGKTTLMRSLKEYAQTEKIPLFHWDNTEDIIAARARCTLTGDMKFYATAFVSSEGEEIVMNLGQNIAKPIGQLIRNNPKSKQFIILIDAIDSGLSLDNIENVKKFLTETLVPLNSDKELYIVISSNSYEFCIGDDFHCLDVYKCSYTDIQTYEEFQKFVLNSRKIVDRRYKK